MNASTVVSAFSDINAQWFTQVLGKEVKEIEVLNLHFSTSGHARIKLIGDSSLPHSVFLKMPPEDPMQRKFISFLAMGPRESKFYAQLASEIPARIPGLIYTATQGDDFIIVLEDLIAKGCSFLNAKHPNILALTGQLVQQMGAMHAKFWCSPRFNTDLAWLAEKGTGVADGGAGFVKMALDKHQHKFDNDFKELAKFYIDNAKDIIIALNKGPKTLNSGDAAIKNMFYDPTQNNVGLVDFGLVNASPGIIDVSYLITNALPANARAQAEKDFLRNYCATLAERGVEYDFNTAWDRYRFSIIYSWVAAAATAGVGSKWLPLELSLDATARLTQACKELDTMALVTNELK